MLALFALMRMFRLVLHVVVGIAAKFLSVVFVGLFGVLFVVSRMIFFCMLVSMLFSVMVDVGPVVFVTRTFFMMRFLFLTGSARRRLDLDFDVRGGRRLLDVVVEVSGLERARLLVIAGLVLAVVDLLTVGGQLQLGACGDELGAL